MLVKFEEEQATDVWKAEEKRQEYGDYVKKQEELIVRRKILVPLTFPISNNSKNGHFTKLRQTIKSAMTIFAENGHCTEAGGVYCDDGHSCELRIGQRTAPELHAINTNFSKRPGS